MTALLQHYVTEQALRDPTAIAVAFKGERMSYAQLHEAGSRLANRPPGGGVQRGDRLCPLMPKSTHAMVAIQAVLKADAIYVPLDPQSPVPRLQRMISVSDDRWILAAGTAGPV